MRNASSTGITRRSFIKRSTVALVGAANITIFSGLVNAEILGASGESLGCNVRTCVKTSSGKGTCTDSSGHTCTCTLDANSDKGWICDKVLS